MWTLVAVRCSDNELMNWCLKDLKCCSLAGVCFGLSPIHKYFLSFFYAWLHEQDCGYWLHTVYKKVIRACVILSKVVIFCLIHSDLYSDFVCSDAFREKDFFLLFLFFFKFFLLLLDLSPFYSDCWRANICTTLTTLVQKCSFGLPWKSTFLFSMFQSVYFHKVWLLTYD